MMDPQFLSLIDRVLDDSATADEIERFETLVIEDDEFAREVAAYASMVGNFQSIAGALPVAQSTVSQGIAQHPAIGYRFSAVLGIAAALFFTLVAVTIYVLVAGDPDDSKVDADPGAPIATIIDATGDLLVNDTLASPGDEAAQGSYSIQSGSAEVLLRGGVSVALHGDTEVLIRGRMAATLTRGSAEFTCPPPAKGYTVYLPHNARVVDLGTRFTVTIDATGNAFVRVEEGRVRVEGDSASRELAVGERVAVLNGRPTELRSLSLADALTGGDGSGDPRPGGIDLTSGRPIEARQDQAGPVASLGRWVPTPEAPFVDGVITPKPGRPIVVDSAGHAFEPITQSTGGAWGAPHVAPDGAVYVHGNAGLTWDIGAMCRHHGFAPVRLVATATHAAKPSQRHLTDGIVLVDGVERWRGRFEIGEQEMTIDVPLQPTDRFVTWIVTDAGDGKSNDAIKLGRAAVEAIVLPSTESRDHEKSEPTE